MELLRTLRSIERWTESIPCFLEGQELFIIRKATEERYATVRETLMGLGFVLHSERKMGDVSFHVLVRKNESLFCSFSPNDRFIRVLRLCSHSCAVLILEPMREWAISSAFAMVDLS